MKPATIARMCREKDRHRTRRLALDAAERHRLRWKSTYRVYRCPHCHGFHLTTRTED